MSEEYIGDLTDEEAFAYMEKRKVGSNDMKKIFDVTGGRIMLLERACDNSGDKLDCVFPFNFIEYTF
jgi:hypothetical protein